MNSFGNNNNNTNGNNVTLQGGSDETNVTTSDNLLLQATTNSSQRWTTTTRNGNSQRTSMTWQANKANLSINLNDNTKNDTTDDQSPVSAANSQSPYEYEPRYRKTWIWAIPGMLLLLSNAFSLIFLFPYCN